MPFWGNIFLLTFAIIISDWIGPHAHFTDGDRGLQRLCGLSKVARLEPRSS